MAEYTMKLRGWHALVGVILVIGLVGIRLLTFNDKTDDPALMEALEVQLMSEYYPDLAERLQTAYETGDREKVAAAVASVTSTTLHINSVQVSAPLLDFSTPKDVVVKVRYSLDDASGAREARTIYYLFRHSALGNHWSYQYVTSAARYYLNFR